MNILAAVDFSAVTRAVLGTLGRIARAIPAKVFLVHVAPPDPAFVGYGAGPKAVRGQVAAEHHTRHQQLQALADELRAGGVDATALLLQGATVDTLLAEAQKLSADLIVLGSHGHGAVHRLLVGSVAEGVVGRSELPVLLVPARLR